MLVQLLLAGMAIGAGQAAADQDSAPNGPDGIGPVTPNALPQITSTLPDGLELFTVSYQSFEFSVQDPDGDPVSLRLLNPPPGAVFQPIEQATERATTTLDWRVLRTQGGRQRLVFEASDGKATTRKVVEVLISGQHESSGMLTGDVTGDGIADTVALARRADTGGTADAGALYVWAGSRVPAPRPAAKLTVPGASPHDMSLEVSNTGYFEGQDVQLGDVTGDSILDIVVTATYSNASGESDAGAIYVWSGGAGLSGEVAPVAVLTAEAPQENDLLGGEAPGLKTLLTDVTGDGVYDIVASASRADDGGDTDSGAVYVWFGGKALTGTPRVPDGTLTVQRATRSYDRLGRANSGQDLLAHDVTGDGVRDVIVGACFVDIAGKANVGAVYVFAGGVASLSGAVDPHAVLAVPGSVEGDLLGSAAGGIQVADVTGDGQLDVVASTHAASFGTTPEAGAIYVWSGGATLSGLAIPIARLTDIYKRPYNWLGAVFHSPHRSIEFADVTGDGVLDVIGRAPYTDAISGRDAGAILIWRGGAGLAGDMTQSVKLRLLDGMSEDRLGTGAQDGSEVHYQDLTGDGVLDILVATPWADLNGEENVGRIQLWVGGGSLRGSPLPLFELQVSDAEEDDRLGYRGVRIADVSGDGTPDVLAASSRTDIAGNEDAGAIYVWLGESASPGVVEESFALAVPSGGSDLELASGTSTNRLGWQLGDVTGDGILDVLAAATSDDVGFEEDAGAIYVWEGGFDSALNGVQSPSARLFSPNAKSDDRLTAGTAGQGWFLVDLSGDGQLDIVACSGSADYAGRVDAGALYVWSGGPHLEGDVSPTLEYGAPNARSHNHLGWIGLAEGGVTPHGQGIQIADVTGDGLPDLLVGATLANVSGVGDAGAIYVLPGAQSLDPAPVFSRLQTQKAALRDWLGF